MGNVVVVAAAPVPFGLAVGTHFTQRWDRHTLHTRCLDTYAFPDPDSALPKVYLKCMLVNEDRDAKFDPLSAFGHLPEDFVLDKEKRKVLHSRMTLFYTSPVPHGTAIDVKFNGSDSKTRLGLTDHTGCVQGDVFIPLDTQGQIGQNTSFELIGPDYINHSEGKILDTYPGGFAVFTDIDDTIKITHVLNYPMMFHEAFLETYNPVPSTPDLFADLQTTLAVSNAPPSNFYVSGTPWQIIDTIRPFLAKYFPQGEIMLQPFTFSIGSLISLTDYLSYKRNMADEVLRRFPGKKLYLIGDSGQKDPEAYAGVYRKHGGDKVACIWIVKTVGTDAVKEAERNNPTRFETAFADVPLDRWYAFFNASELIGLPAGQCRPSHL